MDELTLYHTDRAAWVALIAPRMPAVFAANTDTELSQSWRLMQRDFQRATWEHLDETQRGRLRRLCTQ